MAGINLPNDTWLTSAAADESLPSRQAVFDAMSRRETNARVVMCEWQSHETRNILVGETPFGGAPRSERKTFENTFRRSLELDGDLIRYEDLVPKWDLDRQRFVESESTRVVGASVGKSFWRLARPDSAVLQGTLSTREKEAKHLRAQHDLLPLWDHFRPSWRLRRQLEAAVPEVTRGLIDGSPCAIFKVRKASRSMLRVTSYWIDAAKGNSVVRVIYEVNGKVVLQEDRSYKANDELEWVPNGWTMTERYEDGAVKRVVRAKTTATIVNKAIPPERFDISFPAGTGIIDSIQGKQAYRLSTSNGQISISQKEFLDGGVAQGGSMNGRRTVWYVAFALVLVIGAVIVRFRLLQHFFHRQGAVK